MVVSHLESLNIDNALHFIKQELRVKYEMTGTACGREVYELPLDVIREAVIHAVKNMGTGIGKIRRLLEDAGAPEPLNEPLNELLRRMKAVPTITRHIQKLKPMKRLKRAGSDKTDYWEVL